MERPGVPFEATNHRGLFTRAHAYDDGWSKRQVRRRLQSRRWKVVAGAALCDAATEIGAWELAHAVLLTWPDAVISHQLAGVLHGFPLDGPLVGTATVPLGRSRHAAGLRAHQIVLRPHDITRLGGLPVTAEGRTAVDLLGRLPWDQARSLFAWLTTRNRFSVQDLSAAVAQRKNMAGTTQLRRLVRVSASGSLSAAEDRLHETLRLGGLSGWKANAPILIDGGLVAVADVLFPAKRVVIEVDGFAAHSSRPVFQRDRTKQNQLVAAGFVVLRFTWADLVDRPEHVVATVRAALARAGGQI
jgi:very-short-patch-repair endonuclease